MHQLKLLFTLIFISTFSVVSFSQLTEGSVKFKLELDENQPKFEAVKPVMEESSIKINFNEDFVHVATKIGFTTENKSIVGKKQNKVIVLINQPEEKQAFISTLSAVESMALNFTDIKLLDDKKKILGYKCSKATALDNRGIQNEYWYSEAIDIGITAVGVPKALPGLCLEYTAANGPFKIRYTAIEVKDEQQNSDLFDMSIPDGYQVQSEPENNEIIEGENIEIRKENNSNPLTKDDASQTTEDVRLITRPGSEADELNLLPDEAASFPGGKPKLYEFLGENLQYPKTAYNKGESGTVFLKFIVEKDGSLSSLEVAKGVSQLLDNEAMRVLKMMPKWLPAKYQDKDIRSIYHLPVRFKLKD